MNLWHDNRERLRSFWRFLLGLLVAFIANFIAIGVAVPLMHRSQTILEAIYRPLTLVLLLCGYALLLMSADQVHEHLLEAMGLGQRQGWVRQALLGIAVGAALVGIAVLWIAIAGNLRVRVDVSPQTLAFALLELFILATAAMGEELMFRGYPLQRLLEATAPLGTLCRRAFAGHPLERGGEASGAAIAILVMSLLFGFAHGGNPHASRLAMINTVLIGTLLCLAYVRTGALWMSWGIHVAWNTALGLVFGLPVSGLTDFAVVVKSRASGPRWITGGAYGIEGSYVGTLVILLGFLPLILLTRGRGAAVDSTPRQAEISPRPWDQQSPPDPTAPPRIQES